MIAGWLRQTASLERDEGLADFFEKTLTPQERDHLMSLPGDEIDRELGHLYMAHLMRSDQPNRGDWQRPGRPRTGGPRFRRSPPARHTVARPVNCVVGGLLRSVKQVKLG